MNQSLWKYGLALTGVFIFTACETTPKPKAQTSQDVVKQVSYDARELAQAVRRVDVLRLQQRQNEIAEPCQGKSGDPVCDFIALYVLEDRDAAWKSFDKRAKKDPKDALALLGMEMIYIEWKIEDQAEQNYQAAVALDPQLAIAHSRMGMAYLRKGDDDRANTYFVKALAVDAQDGDALLGQARIAQRGHDDEKALKLYKQCMQAWPENSVPAEEAAKIELKFDHADAAADLYRQAADRAPHAVGLRRSLASLYARQDKNTLALATYKEVIALDPKNFASLVALAKLAEQAGDDDAAFDYYRRAAQANENDVEVQRALGRAYLKRNQPSGAESAFSQVLKLANDDAEAHKALAVINVEAKRFSEAVGHYRAGLAKAPDAKMNKARLALENSLNISPRPIKASSVNSVFNKALGRILKLYKERLKKRPKLSGTITLKVSINPDGSVKDFKMTQDTVKDAYMQACIEWNIRDAIFPKAAKTRHYTYPITFDR